MLWKPAFFGVKPEMIVKGGFIAWSVMGDANASIPTPQPVLYRPMFGSFGARAAIHRRHVHFDSLAAAYVETLGLKKRLVPVQNCRQHRKGGHDPQFGHAHIEVDPETYEVRADGELLTCEPATRFAAGAAIFSFLTYEP